jgi:drug/metabolite transporter (DMT)-like permease
MTSKSLPGVLAGLGAASIWGGMYVVSKVVLDVIPPFSLITLRLALGMGTLYLVVLLRGGLHLGGREFLHLAGIGFIGYGVSLGLQFIGTKLSTAGNGALVTSATPALVLVFASLILGERATGRSLLALGISTLGLILVIDPRNARLDPNLFLGNVCLLLAAVTWALYSVLIGRAGRSRDVYHLTLAAFAGGYLVSIPGAAWEVQHGGIGQLTGGIILGVLFLGIVATGLAMLLWNTAFAVLPSSLASLTFFAQPVVGALLGAWLLGEPVTPGLITGGVLIGAGLLIAPSSDHR